MAKTTLKEDIISIFQGAPLPKDAIELLEEQHRSLEDLFKLFESQGERALKTRWKIFHQISHMLSCHAEIEEKVLYPAAKKIDKDNTLEAIEEHNTLKFLLREISTLSENDETFKAKMEVLRELNEHHVKEEENEFFPHLRKEMSKDELIELGEKMQKLYLKLDQKHNEPKIKALK